MEQLIAAINDIQNPLYYYWEEAYSTNLAENFIITLN